MRSLETSPGHFRRPFVFHPRRVIARGFQTLAVFLVKGKR